MAALSGLVACGSSSTTGPGAGNGSITANIGGSSWTASVGVNAVHSANIISLGGGKINPSESFAMAFVDAGVGTYTIGPLSPTNALFNQGAKGWVASPVGGSGTITVTALDAVHVAGTFTFTMVDNGGGGGTLAVTNGQFDVKF